MHDLALDRSPAAIALLGRQKREFHVVEEGRSRGRY